MKTKVSEMNIGECMTTTDGTIWMKTEHVCAINYNAGEYDVMFVAMTGLVGTTSWSSIEFEPPAIFPTLAAAMEER